jgi:hypothetical protein
MIVLLWFTLPDMPLMVTFETPGTALLAAVNVTTLLLAVTAPKVAVTPGGKPDALNATAPLKPY